MSYPIRPQALCFVVLSFVSLPLLSAAQRGTVQSGAQSRAQPAPSPQEVDAALASARTLLQSGRTEDALAAVDALLARQPANVAATQFKLTTLVERDRFAEALGAYDRLVTARGGPDAASLALIARADLKHTLQQERDDPIMTAAALERLARDGDTDALQQLRRSTTTAAAARTPEALAPVTSLARLDDKQGTARLGSLLDGASAQEEMLVIRAIQDAGVRSLCPKLMASLADPDLQVRATAAKALGALQCTDAIPRLQMLLKDEEGGVRLFAATALKRLGQPSGDTIVADVMKSEVAEARLMAAEGYQSSRTAQWTAPLKDVLQDRSEMNRVRAAELLACCEPDVARSALTVALDSPNPLLRTEAARVLESRSLATLQLARRMLGDPFAIVRVYGAGATLAVASATPRR